MNNRSIPHPFPYQGSKRGIARRILAQLPRDARRLVEPFCGTAAVSLAAAAERPALRCRLNDLNAPLIALWREILDDPAGLADRYEALWHAQQADSRTFFLRVRREFNAAPESARLLYLLARVVKGAVRYNAQGEFNQSADNRRLGMRPPAMRKHLAAVSHLLADRATLSAVDFRALAAELEPGDVVYMDPPYQGTSSARDGRYCAGVSYDDFVDFLDALNKKSVAYIVSYDGSTGGRAHGKPLPKQLSLKRLHIRAGRSSQATLLGRADDTVESLYLSPALRDKLSSERAHNRMGSERPRESAFCRAPAVAQREAGHVI